MTQLAIQLQRHEDRPTEVIETTLLDLVAAVADSSANDAEVIATVSELIRSGKVHLVGNFRRADVRLG